MDLDSRPIAPHPDEALPKLPTFTLKSNAANDMQVMPAAQTAPGGSVSPHLSWSGFPAQTQSFFLYCFDPDAPTPAGYWHWGIVDIPAEITELNEGGRIRSASRGPGFPSAKRRGASQLLRSQPAQR